jgi:hypothetical protein
MQLPATLDQAVAKGIWNPDATETEHWNHWIESGRAAERPDLC